MEKKLEWKLNLLTAYAVVSTIVFGAILTMSFNSNNDNKVAVYDEITAKRINVISEDGELRMVVSNEFRQHPGRVNGQDIEKRDRPAGILFFNEEGDECGGIIHWGKTADGATSSGMSFTMDQYKEDQVLQIINNEYYSEGKQSIQRGVAISDLPTGSDLLTRMKKIEEIQKILSTSSPEEQQKIIEQYGNSLSSIQRLFIGKTKKNNAGIFLAGPDGKQKLNIYVDENNIPKIEVIDEKGITSNILKQD